MKTYPIKEADKNLLKELKNTCPRGLDSFINTYWGMMKGIEQAFVDNAVPKNSRLWLMVEKMAEDEAALVKEWTTAFELQYKDMFWDGGPEWSECIDAFIQENNTVKK